jgi:phosphoribosylglycinamide formyltransferase-1
MLLKKPVAVLISGSGSNLQALIDAAKQPNFPAEIMLVISNKADAYGLERARKAGIATEVIDHKAFSDRENFDRAVHARIVESGCEIVCLAGFMRLITPWFVDQWIDRMLNIHPSLLPDFKGLNTHKRALEAGVSKAGCTVHFVRAEMDAGPIILQESVPIKAGDTPEILAARVLEKEHIAYPKALALVASGDI